MTVLLPVYALCLVDHKVYISIVIII
jgi:hypothetical protein